MMNEVWKDIPGKPPYQASNMGRIRNGEKVNIIKPVRWGSRGHVAVKVGGGRKASKHYVHRLVLMAFCGLPKKGQIGCHINDVKTDNKISNLYWGTYKENTADQIRNDKFFFAVGEKNGMTKFKDDAVANILKEYTGKRGQQTQLAKKYGMSISNVHLIVHGKARAA